MWGIGLLAGVGAVAVRGDEKLRRHPVTGVAYGSGLALIVDEFALLLDLKDVYWAREGRVSVDIGVGVSSVAGSYFAALPVLREVARKRGLPQPDNALEKIRALRKTRATANRPEPEGQAAGEPGSS
jgi:hypothetical protein